MLAVADLPEAPDLALIAVPAPAVLDVAEDCGRLGVKALAVITSGLDTAACADLLAVCRRHSIRLVGPDSFGIAVPGLGLDATFAASHPRPGVAGLVMQSGGVGLAMVDQLSRLGIGISSFASVGRKLDVSSNDMLLWWEQDEVTKLAVLYIESFGNPRKFARTARRVGARIPVLTVHAGRFAADQDTAASHPAAAALARRVRRPRPGRAPSGRDYRPQAAHAGPRAGAGAVAGPVDTTAAISGEAFRQCLELVAADENVDAVIALVLPTGATGDLVQAIRQADVSVPMAAVVLNQAESVRLLDDAIPAYASRGRRRAPSPARPRTGRGARSHAERCPPSPTCEPPTRAPSCASTSTRMPGAAGCRPARPPTCCAATGSRSPKPPRRPISTRLRSPCGSSTTRGHACAANHR